ncbi:MAG: hypothetical protein HY983_01520 [Candidatus Magasanikbacteria bacterium]|nr:hypothetical protein [Candidatus Magasanikbacteria bacterium]
MDKVYHKNLAAGRWFTLSLAEQLGNVGSEVGRAISSGQRGEKNQEEKAKERALELFDLTVSDRRWSARLKELVRGREVLADWFYGNNIYGSSPENLEKYFYYFAYAARRVR